MQAASGVKHKTKMKVAIVVSAVNVETVDSVAEAVAVAAAEETIEMVAEAVETKVGTGDVEAIEEEEGLGSIEEEVVVVEVVEVVEAIGETEGVNSALLFSLTSDDVLHQIHLNAMKPIITLL